MDFIFMLTRGDKTVEDCLELFDLIAPIGLQHIGFKDVGVPPETLEKLATKIRASGATSYLEVVSTSPETCLRSARLGRDIGIDRLLGGTDVAEILAILKGSNTTYYPFPGRPHGHPTQLGGLPADIEMQCRAFRKAGCPGADLLAYRSTDADPIDLVKAARRGLDDGYLVVAGSVTSIDRIRAIKDAGADAFTIGTAVFDGSYSPHSGSTVSQLKAIVADCQRVASRQVA
jgi:hypothetical protein